MEQATSIAENCRGHGLDPALEPQEPIVQSSGRSCEWQVIASMMGRLCLSSVGKVKCLLRVHPFFWGLQCGRVAAGLGS